MLHGSKGVYRGFIGGDRCMCVYRRWTHVCIDRVCMWYILVKGLACVFTGKIRCANVPRANDRSLSEALLAFPSTHYI